MSNLFAVTIGREKLKQRGIAEIFFEIGAMSEVVGVDLGHRQTMFAKVTRELDKGGILLANVVKNADGASALANQANDATSRTAELTLQRLNAHDWRAKMLLEKLSENIHEVMGQRYHRGRERMYATTDTWVLRFAQDDSGTCVHGAGQLRRVARRAVRASMASWAA